MKTDKALTWDELADEFDKEFPGSGRPARTMEMHHVFNQMKKRTDKYYVDPIEGTIHKILEKQ